MRWRVVASVVAVAAVGGGAGFFLFSEIAFTES
jgi:hypothetical protein